jgi:hypothetical protein
LLEDAHLAIARYDDILDRSALVACVAAVPQDGSIFELEAAVEAVVSGELGLAARLICCDYSPVARCRRGPEPLQP